MRKERWHTEPGPDPAHPSRSQVKRDYEDLQAFVLRLGNLPPARLAAIEMPDSLRDALTELNRLKNNNAQRRQGRYVTKLIEGVDLAPFEQVLTTGQLKPRRNK